MTTILSSIRGGVFWPLFAAGVAGSIAALPYLLAVAEARPELTTGPRPPLLWIILGTIAQSAILLAVVVAAGLLLADAVGLRIPILEGWADGTAPVSVRAVLRRSLLWGLGAGVTMVAAEILFFAPRLPAEFHPLFDIALWKRLLAGVVYGGVTEELLTRLFLVSLFAWLFGLVWTSPHGVPAPGAFWAAIVVTGLGFGALHLPITAAMAPLSPLVVARALVLNGFAGVVFGFLFWRYGLESAIIAHASAHLILQGPGFALIRLVLPTQPLP